MLNRPAKFLSIMPSAIVNSIASVIFEYMWPSNCIREGNLNPANHSFAELNPVKILSKLRNTKFYLTPIGLSGFDHTAIGKSLLESA